MILHSISSLLATGLVLAPAGPDDCDGVYKKFLSHPGYQPDAETSTNCGESSVTVHVKVKGDGSIIIASGEVEGSIAVTVKTPSSCPSQKLWINEDLHTCGQPLKGWNCNPEARKIPIKLYSNTDPCPEIPTGDALEAFIGGSWVPSTIPNIPLTVPCKELTDITNTLPKGARYRWTAQATRCKKEGAYEVPTSIEHYASKGGSSEVYGLYGEAVFGDPAEYNFGAFVDEGAVLPGVTVIEGLDKLGEELAKHDGKADNALAQSIAGAYPALDWIDNLHVSVSTSNLVKEVGDWVESEMSFLCHLRDSGDFQVSKTFGLELEEGGVDVFTESFTMVAGNLYSSLQGGNASMAHLGVNGAATLAMQGPLGELDYIQKWFNNPIRVSNSGVMNHEEIKIPEGTVLTQAVGYEVAEEAEFSMLVLALVGSRWEVELNEAGTPLEAIRVDQFTGVIRERHSFSRHAAIAPGVMRPMTVGIEEFNDRGELVRTVNLEFAGARREGSEPITFSVPTTLDNSWYVRAK